MGKDYLPLKMNGYDLKSVFVYLKKFEISEASENAYFNKNFSFSIVDEIEIGTDGTKESIIRFKDGGFAVVEKTLDVSKLKRG